MMFRGGTTLNDRIYTLNVDIYEVNDRGRPFFKVGGTILNDIVRSWNDLERRCSEVERSS